MILQNYRVQLAFFWTSVAIYGVNAGQKCLSCKSIPEPTECSFVTECGSHEQCYVQKYVNEAGHLMYDLGCADHFVCNEFPRNRKLQRVLGKHNAIVCEACCNDTKICNNKNLCGSQELPDSSGTICYACDYQTHPESCDQITLCSIDRACYIGVSRDETTMLYHYVTGCALKETKCRTLTQFLDNPYCSRCCEGDLCNDRCHSNLTNDKLCLDRNPFCPLLKDKCNTVSEVRLTCPGTCSLCQEHNLSTPHKYNVTTGYQNHTSTTPTNTITSPSYAVSLTATTSFPTSPTSFPTSTTSFPTSTTSFPSSTTSFPTSTTSFPTSTTSFPSSTTSFPTSTTSVPTSTTSFPSSTTSFPSSATSFPTSTTKTSTTSTAAVSPSTIRSTITSFSSSFTSSSSPSTSSSSSSSSSFLSSSSSFLSSSSSSSSTTKTTSSIVSYSPTIHSSVTSGQHNTDNAGNITGSSIQTDRTVQTNNVTALSTQASISTTSDVCVDANNVDCKHYELFKICNQTSIYYGWAQINCPFTCGICRTVGCNDTKPNCDEYEEGFCTNHGYTNFVFLNCRRYCNMC